jgi:amino acid transporter
MPLEVMAAAITLDYWNLPIPGGAAITVFLSIIIAINLCGVKIYGEAEYTFSIIKVIAVIGFMYVTPFHLYHTLTSVASWAS